MYDSRRYVEDRSNRRRSASKRHRKCSLLDWRSFRKGSHDVRGDRQRLQDRKNPHENPFPNYQSRNSVCPDRALEQLGKRRNRNLHNVFLILQTDSASTHLPRTWQTGCVRAKRKKALGVLDSKKEQDDLMDSKKRAWGSLLRLYDIIIHAAKPLEVDSIA